MKLLSWILASALLGLSSCSSELKFVKAQPKEQHSNIHQDVLAIEKPDDSTRLKEGEVAESTLIYAEQSSENTYQTKPDKKKESPDINSSNQSLTQILAKYPKAYDKVVYKMKAKQTAMAVPPPSKSQKTKTYIGAILMGLGVVGLFLGIFASPIAWWAIIVSAIVILFGAALLVSGSMSGWNRD
ncbi:hypothetical protein C3K47_00945 [Solitalea longa]|uniref:Uncharacterized protein n=1 Tax=Solitalea longa TaxID=2079460 RepID=A0A2S5A996_9SPHI|nr:DUF308 domain-containing protein [Solitalea longa]POY39096.1 hypothetical protein C3K47_00945 [Solitalea longa]